MLSGGLFAREGMLPDEVNETTLVLLLFVMCNETTTPTTKPIQQAYHSGGNKMHDQHNKVDLLYQI